MNVSKPVLALSVALGMLAAGAANASDHQHRYGTQGQSPAVRHTAQAAKPSAATIAIPKPDVSAAAGAAYGSAGSAVDPQTALDALAVQHRDKDWKHNHESWCDVDPKCNGWNKNLDTYEQSLK